MIFSNTAPASGSGRGKRWTSRRPGACITAARTVALIGLDSLRISFLEPRAGELERYRIFGLQLPAVVGIGGHEPAPVWTGHDIEVVKVVTRTCHHRVVAPRDKN